jgi:tetratricopeptide (TPR) repeat protein
MSLSHAGHFLGLARDAKAGLSGADHARWLRRLDADLDNLRAALLWSVENDEVELGLRLAAALERFWEARGHAAELRRWFEAALPAADGVALDVQASAQLVSGRLTMLLSDYPRAQPILEGAVALFRQTGDRGGLAQGLANLGWISMMQGDFDEAQASCEEAIELARGLGDKTILSRVLNNLGGVLGEKGDHAAAAAVFEESLAVHREVGSPRLPIALCNLGLSLLRAGDYEQGRAAIEEAVERAREMRDTWQLASTLGFLGWAALWGGRNGEAFDHFETSLVLRQELGERRYSIDCIQGLAGVAASVGEPERAARLWGAAEAALEELGTPLTPADREFQSQFVEQARGKLTDAVWNEAFEAGRRLPLSEAIAYARETTVPSAAKTK